MSVVMSSTLVLPTEDAYPTRAPRLQNVEEAVWSGMRGLAYRFARQVRHDIINLQTGLQMLEAVEQMVQGGTATDLPPECDPRLLREQTNLDMRRMVQMSSVMSFLSQAANAEAYAPTQCQPLSEVLEMGIAMHLGPESAAVGRLMEQCGSLEVVTMGDMLPMAWCACFFQWAPLLHESKAAEQAAITADHRRVVLSVPADDSDAVRGFASNCGSDVRRLAAQANAHEVQLSTAELALWMAAHVLTLHGGGLVVRQAEQGPVIRAWTPLPQGTP